MDVADDGHIAIDSDQVRLPGTQLSRPHEQRHEAVLGKLAALPDPVTDQPVVTSMHIALVLLEDAQLAEWLLGWGLDPPHLAIVKGVGQVVAWIQQLLLLRRSCRRSITSAYHLKVYNQRYFFSYI